MRHRAFLSLLAAISLHAGAAQSQWFPNGTAVSTANLNQLYPAVVSDGAGGAIIAWVDQRSGEDIYAQRVSEFGLLLWNPDGVPIVTAIESQTDVAMVADGSGGAILVWVDDQQGVTNLDLYAQRVNASGALMWGAGVPISTPIGSQRNPVIVSDDEGGAIIAWEDFRNGNWDVYTQRVNFLGSRVWTNNGVAVATHTALQGDLSMIRDGIGGFIVAWEDYRDGTNGELFAQRKNSAGIDVWAAGGRSMTSGSDVSGDFGKPAAASDDQSGAIVAWHEGVSGDLRVQHIDFFGNVNWAAGGVSIGDHLLTGVHSIIPDGASGAILVWEQQLDLTNIDIFAQRVDLLGAKMWATGGVNISDAPATQRFPALAGNGQGGAIVVWNAHDNTTLYDLYAQRIDASGTLSPGPGGEVVSTAAGNELAHVITSGNDAIVAWMDSRNGITNYDIYATPVTSSTTDAGGRTPAAPLSVLSNLPNPFAMTTTIRFVLSEPASVTFELFDVAGRRIHVARLAALSAGLHTLPFSARDFSASVLPSGVYLYRLTAGEHQVAHKLVLVR